MVGYAFTVVGIEAMCAARALDLAGGPSSSAIREAHARVRRHVRGYDGDRVLSEDIEACADMLKKGSLLR